MAVVVVGEVRRAVDAGLLIGSGASSDTNAQGSLGAASSGLPGPIVAVGGGSPMDVAKMIGVVIGHGRRIESYLGTNTVPGAIPPLYCLATTYGTGSEVTPFAVLTNPKTQNKDPVISWHIAPLVGILDPELCAALPISVGGPTGMDALTHAIESYTNLLANPITDAYWNIRLPSRPAHRAASTGRRTLRMSGSVLHSDVFPCASATRSDSEP